MPHTHFGAVSEVALLMHVLDIQWNMVAELLECPASRLMDGEGQPVYASVYFAEVGGFPEAGLGAFGPDDDVEVVSAVGRYGKTVLDGVHHLHPAGVLPRDLPSTLPPGPYVRLSNVLVSIG